LFNGLVVAMRVWILAVMNSPWFRLFLGLVGLCLIGPGGLNGAAPRVEDTDGDGRISRSEWAGYTARSWVKRSDGNGDGLVTKEEIRRATPVQPGGRAPQKPVVVLDFDEVDTDRDGKISAMELTKALGRDKRFGLEVDDYDIESEWRTSPRMLRSSPVNVGIRFRF
jgi:hypothetical protein